MSATREELVEQIVKVQESLSSNPSPELNEQLKVLVEKLNKLNESENKKRLLTDAAQPKKGVL